MVKELQRKIERLKEEIEEIKTKIKMIDNPAPKAAADTAAVADTADEAEK